jgi:hypothetical protein
MVFGWRDWVVTGSWVVDVVLRVVFWVERPCALHGLILDSVSGNG